MQAMKSYLIANPKGGSGKSTLATNLAGYFARAGARVVIGDADRQQSAHEWLAIRSRLLPPIGSWDPDGDERPPKETTHVVLDSAAGMHGKALERVLRQATDVIVPVQPSLFDILATGRFLETLLAEKAVRKERIRVAVVGMRVDARTRAAGELERFLASYELPVLSYLRDTQLYVQLAANGMTVFDLSAARGEKDIEQWRPVIDWVDAD
jgi:chromosome partitioning protein